MLIIASEMANKAVKTAGPAALRTVKPAAAKAAKQKALETARPGAAEAKPKTAPKNRRSLILISLSGFFYAIANGTMWFILPTFIQSNITADISMISLLIAVPYILALLFDLPIGTLSDYIGRKKVIIAGLVVLIPFGLALPYAANLIGLIVFLLMFGLLSVLVMPVARAFIMDLAYTTGPMIGGLIAAFANTVSSVFMGMGIILVVSGAALAFAARGQKDLL